MKCCASIRAFNGLVKALFCRYDARHMPTRTTQEILADVEQALDTVREGIALHAGGVKVIAFDAASGVLSVEMQGMCVGCPMSELTLKAGIEETVRMAVPEVTSVVNVQAQPHA
jgi:Fe-S cluster biogenesis protein NfuA